MGKSVISEAVGIFGGTFNPVHHGHLRVASTLAEHLGVAQMRMLPCALPPHRELPKVSAAQRLAMLELALKGQSVLRADGLELRRQGPSYSIDTLVQVRREIGEQVPLFFCMGMDTLAGLNSWQRWRELLDHCHIVVSSRPGWALPNQEPLAGWISQNRRNDINVVKSCAQGHIYFCDRVNLDLSSTAVRDKLEKGNCTADMLPVAVANYIKQYQLYE